MSISEQLMGNLSNVYNLRLKQNECEKHMQYMHTIIRTLYFRKIITFFIDADTRYFKH